LRVRNPLYLETPTLLLDLAVMEENMQAMARFVHRSPAKLRPHFKNHRVLALAARQIEAGAIGMTCARLWEAERLVQNGIESILVANEIAGSTAVKRFVELSGEAPVIVAVDNAIAIADLAFEARRRRTEVNVLIDVDLGFKRCGVQPGEEIVS
jgi:D-serine deaminase-like pyridoxal phosphate-dependent protein